jgi:very-short-patch-repair endonuclease
MRGPKLTSTERARLLRKSENDAEERLWFHLRARRLNGLKFVRQLPIGPYFADFACREARLVVEIDGSQHAELAYDRRRDSYMTEEGWSVARFWNVDVLRETNDVLETIVAICEDRLLEDVVSTEFRFSRRRV